jgi:hypothetical protein
VQESSDIGRWSLVLRGRATEHGLGGQHLNQATQASHECDPAGLAVFVRLPASSFRDQLHFGPLERDAQLVEEASRDPSQSHQGLQGLPQDVTGLFLLLRFCSS